MSLPYGRHVALLLLSLTLWGAQTAVATPPVNNDLASRLVARDEPAEEPGADEPPTEDPPTQESEPSTPPAEEPKADEPKGDEPKEEPAAEPQEEPKQEETPPAETEDPKGDKSAETKPDDEPKDAEPKDEPQPPAPLPDTIKVEKFLILPKPGNYGRAAIQVDPVEAAIASGKWKTPTAGDNLDSAEGRPLRWRSGRVDGAGVLSTTSITGGGYAVAEVECPADAIYLLRATGHAAVYVNGQLRAGDVYQLGGFDLPVELRKGKNELVFHVYQPQLKAELLRPESPQMLLSDLAVAPTPVAGMDDRVWIGLPLVNATREPLEGARLVAQVDGGEAVETPLPWIDGATFYNASFEVAIPTSVTSRSLPLEVTLMRGDEPLATERLDLTIVSEGEKQVRTFRSKVDLSVQSYAVHPASDNAPASDLVSEEVSSAKAKGAIVALHGLGSTAEEFLGHYAPKSWAHVIAPAGRGRYGFDWEDWSRIDAVEALDDAQQHFDIDSTRVYLSGYAAGGHGALVLAASEPQRFAAVATSGAWTSLWTYGGGRPQYADPTPPQQMLLRCANPSATDKLLANLRGTSVLVQHGSDDKQVPLAEARVLMASLAAAHDNYRFIERIGADSWWGAETVDGQQVLEFLASHQQPADDSHVIELATSDIDMVSRRGWVGVGAQEQPYNLSTLRAERKGDKVPAIEITTENVERLYLTKGAVPAQTSFTVRIDGSRPIRLRGMPASGEIWFAKRGNNWTRVLSDKKLKGPHRPGGFKSLFNRDAVLVYGTKGSEEENAWARAKARFDAESFYYRGRGSLEVIPDTQFRADADRDRNVVLYGNADTNRAWPALLSLSPVQVRRDHVQVDLRPEADSALGVLMVRPRPGSDTALVGVVGGTNAHGMRLTSRLRYFMAGVNYPDLMILGPQALEEGDDDLRAAGFFATDWDVDDEDLLWRDLAL